MFTLQSGQIENALRGGGVGDTSAKEVVQGLANCQGPLQHRGSMVFAKNPRDNRFMFPSLPPATGGPNFYVSPSIINRQTIINIPPWQNIPWEPIPYPEQEQWEPIPYPEWPPGQYPWDDTSVVVNGPTYMGDVTTNNLQSGTINSQNISNAGDLVNRNEFIQGGPTINRGPVTNDHNVVNNHNVVNKQVVRNEGPVFNGNVTHTNVAHNYDTHNHNITNHYGDTYLTAVYSSGPNQFAGDTYIDGGDVYVDGDTFNVDSTTVNVNGDTINIGGDNTTEVTIEGDTITLAGPIVFSPPDGGPDVGPLSGLSVDLLTDVEWDSSTLTLKKKYRTISMIGALAAEQEENILTGTSCPSTPVNASAGNLLDMP